MVVNGDHGMCVLFHAPMLSDLSQLFLPGWSRGRKRGCLYSEAVLNPVLATDWMGEVSRVEYGARAACLLCGHQATAAGRMSARSGGRDLEERTRIVLHEGL